MVDPSAFAPFDFAQSYGKGLQLHEMQRQQQDKRKLSELLPQAVHGNQQAIDQIAQIDPQLFMHLDDRQKQQAQAELHDVSSAVRWALSDPNQKAQRWNQVVDYYSQHVPQVAQYRDHPEMAETALLQLGQIGEYLKGAQGGEPTTFQRDYQFLQSKDPKLADQYLHQHAEGAPLVANNGDGTFTIIPRGYSGGQPAQNIPPPPPGFVIEGGPSPSGSGGFPGSGYGPR